MNFSIDASPLAAAFHQRSFNMLNRIISTLAVCVLLGCAANSAVAQDRNALPSVTLPPELDRVLRDYERQWRLRSASGLSKLFTEDGFVLPPGQPPTRGREAIMERYQGRGGPLSLRALKFAASDSIGYIIGGYAVSEGEPDIGKFILLVERIRPGPWYIAADMDNGNSRD
jgi:hypothetical protein